MALYVALCYYDRDQYWDSPPETEFSPEYMEFARRATEAGVMRGGEALHPVTMSTTITVSGGKGGDVLLVDGPYAEAKEVLGGYFLLEAADLRPTGHRRVAVVYQVAPTQPGGGTSGPCRSRGRGDPAGPPRPEPARGAFPACLVAADLGPHLRPHRCRR